MIKVQRFALTTEDNPFNPTTDFDAWNSWDMAAGYNTLALLARVGVSSMELSEDDEARAINEAMDAIVSMHDNGFYIKVPYPD